MEIKRVTSMYAYVESWQVSPVKFSLVSKDNCEVFLPVKCRDYFQDVLWSQYTGRKAEMYGFRYHHGVTKPEARFDETWLLVYDLPDVACDNALAMLQKLAQIGGMSPWRREKCGGEWLFYGDKGWMEGPVVLALATLTIRIAWYHKDNADSRKMDIAKFLTKINPMGMEDASYCASVSGVAEGVMRLRDKLTTKLIVDSGTGYSDGCSGIHRCGGVVSFANGNVLSAHMKKVRAEIK